MKKEVQLRYGIILALLSYLVYGFIFGFMTLQRLTAQAVGQGLSWLGLKTFVSDRLLIVFLDGYNRFFDISAECAGIVLYVAFLAVIFILPGFTMKARMYGLVFLPLIFVVNVIRIMGSVWFVKEVSDNAAIVYHDTLSQVMIIGATFLCYLLWLFLIAKKEPMEVRV